MNRWYSSRFTGLFSEFGELEARAHDPFVALFAGHLPPRGGRMQALDSGGAGWQRDEAEAAAVGEAIERLQPYRLSCDHAIAASYTGWRLDEPAIAPERWVLFSAEQYARAGFPFRPLTPQTPCDWVCFREASTGLPAWIPDEFAYLFPVAGQTHVLAPATSTGLSCGRSDRPVLLRGAQEVVERDALIGAWWRRYPLEEYESAQVLESLERQLAVRILRPNLRYRFYRVLSPFSEHVTLVTLSGDDHEGFCFSIGSACRQTRSDSWSKSILEAIHGRHYVRYLKKKRTAGASTAGPRDFAEHALYYSLHPQQLAQTVLHAARSATHLDSSPEDLSVLLERLGPQRPILFRNLTPPGIASANLGWYVLKVVIPGLTPLHGMHQFPHLGSSLWQPRRLAEATDWPPHPFP